jgi:hypothetical protein
MDIPNLRRGQPRQLNSGSGYLARIEDLGQSDFEVDCPACHHVAPLTPEALLKLGLSPRAKGLELKKRRQSPRGTKPKAFTLRLSHSSREQ